MPQITEDEYAMRFGMLIVLDERKASGMNRYAENMKYLLEQYHRILKEHPGIILKEAKEDSDGEEYKEKAHTLTQLCQVGNISLILRQGGPNQSALFAMLVEAIYRTLILVRYYAPDGELLYEVLKETYCTGRHLSEVQLCASLCISRATYYRRKQKGILYAGYFFYEAVLPEMEGRL